LAGFAVIVNALRLLNLGVDKQNSLEFCQLLQSPYLLAAEPEREPRLQLQLYLRRNANPTCRLSRLSEQMSKKDRLWHCPQLAELLLHIRTLVRACPRSQSARDWVDCFRNILQLAGWPGTAVTATETVTVQVWQGLLDRLSGYGNTLGKLSLEQMLARLRTASSRTNIDKPHDPRCRVTFYSPEQAIGLRMTHVWMLGMDDQSWPPTSAPAPFLPYELQRRFDMPDSHAAVQQRDSASIIELLCRAAGRQLISSHSLFVDEQERRPAACFAAAPLQEINIGFPVQGLSSTTDIKTNTLLELVPDRIALPWLNEAPLNGDSALPGSQSSCPFQAFARYRLKARPLEQFVSGLSPAARGAAVHKALEHFWSQLKDSQQLLALNAEQLEQLLDSAVETAVSDLQYRHPEILTPAFRQLEKQRLHALLTDFLEEERRRNPFTVLKLEQSLSWQRGPLQLRLKSDRIDQMEDGSLALLDYKSGKQIANPLRWLDERPLDLQLPLYQYAVTREYKEPVSAVVIAHINVEKTGFGGVWEKEHFLPAPCPVKLPLEYQDNWESLLQRWQQSIDRLADEFIEGRLCVSPAHRVNSCLHCGLQGLCRITEIDAGTHYEEGETGGESIPEIREIAEKHLP
ncbi:MAG: PD-(D/E)XK nuclease family protein, partial [Pseudohongiellaceae bacterium]